MPGDRDGRGRRRSLPLVHRPYRARQCALLSGTLHSAERADPASVGHVREAGMVTPGRALLRTLLDAAIAAAAPPICIPPPLPQPPHGRPVVAGAGNAQPAIAQAFARPWTG